MQSSTDQPPRIDTLLQLVPEHPDRVAQYLEQHPELASAADSNGTNYYLSRLHYTLFHAASSYSHTDLLTTLLRTHTADPNARDNDGDTPLFYAETLEAARCLVANCGADWTVRNEEGVTAEENALENVEIGDEGAWAEVAEFLERCRKGIGSVVGGVGGGVQGVVDGAPVLDAENGDIGNATLGQVAGQPLDGVANAQTADVHPPPPLPPNVRINVGTMTEEEQRALDAEPDPEFRRRIEELAAREDFQSAEGQEELRKLVQDAVGGLREDEGHEGDGRNVRRRV